MNCPQEECEGCPVFAVGCDKPQAWDYRAELDAEQRHDPVTERLDEIAVRVDQLTDDLETLRTDFDRVIAAVRKATVQEVE